MKLPLGTRVVNAKVLAATETAAICYKKGSLYTLDYRNWELKALCKLPMSGKTKLFSKFRLIERLLRLEPRTACVLDDGQFLLSYQGGAYRVDTQRRAIEKELDFRAGMNNPLSIVTIKGLGGFDNCVLFGEYFSNNSFEEVNVWRRINGLWDIALTLPAGSLYHIHGIVPDYKNSCIYILTGDSDKESAIIKVTDNFKTVTPILYGSQQFRSCVAFPYKEGLLYATDTPREINHIYYASPVDDKWTTEPVCEIPGPCIYGREQGEVYYFATSVEADDTLPPFRYRFSYKLGVGVKNRNSHIIKVSQNLNVEPLYSFKKDLWPMLLFQFGNCIFPANECDDMLMVCPVSVKRFDGKTLIFKL